MDEYDELLRSAWGWIYFMEMVDFEHIPLVKIGWSMRPDQRAAALSAQSPFKMRVLAAIAGEMSLEKTMHDIFDQERFRGEWYTRSPLLDRYISEALEKFGPEPWALSREELAKRLPDPSFVGLFQKYATEKDTRKVLDAIRLKAEVMELGYPE